MAFLGHELACQIGQEDNFFVKLEVISDPKYLLPDPIGTLKAAEFLVKKGFTVLPYINADPMLSITFRRFRMCYCYAIRFTNWLWSRIK